MRLSFLLPAGAFLLGLAEGAPLRSRAEGLPGVESANTVGPGDIWVTLESEGVFRTEPVPEERLLGLADTAFRRDLRGLMGEGKQVRRELGVFPRLKAAFGLASFLQFAAESVPWDGEKLGTTTAWLKATTPGNDQLRLFGFSLALGTTFSSEEDHYSRNAVTPGFESFFHFLAAADLDWIRYSASFPVKLYANYASLEDPRLIHAYGQHKFQAAAEWKGFRGGGYLRLASFLYKRLPTRFDPEPAGTWKPLFHEVAAGWRWMAGDRLTFTAEASADPVSPWAFYRDEARKPPRLRLEISLPVYARENQAEALRALLFMEESRRRLRRQAAAATPRDGGADSAQAAALPVNLDALTLSPGRGLKEGELLKDILGDEEKAIRERRQKIRSELKEIEDLLE